MADLIRLKVPDSEVIVSVTSEKAARLNWPRADETPAPDSASEPEPPTKPTRRGTTK